MPKWRSTLNPVPVVGTRKEGSQSLFMVKTVGEEKPNPEPRKRRRRSSFFLASDGKKEMGPIWFSSRPHSQSELNSHTATTLWKNQTEHRKSLIFKLLEDVFTDFVCPITYFTVYRLPCYMKVENCFPLRCTTSSQNKKKNLKNSWSKDRIPGC